MNTFSRSLKVSRVDDDLHMVWGTAATEQEASDGMVLTMEALQDAWPAYMEYANVREMHQEIAAGVVKEYRFTPENSLEIGVKVSDPTTWQKVKDGVLKGFSVCGDILAKVENVITKLALMEISLVDRPADPGAVVTLFRAAGARDDNQTRGAAPEGGKMPNPTAPQKGRVKRDAGGDVSQQIADNEETPLDAQLDVIGVLMQKFQEFQDLIDQLGGDSSVHPDVLANCMRAHQAMGRAVKAHIDNATSYGGKDGSDGAADGDEAPAEGDKPAEPDAVAKRAVQVHAAAVKRAATPDPRIDALVDGMAKLGAAVESIVKRSADPRSSYVPAVGVTADPNASKTQTAEQIQHSQTSDRFGPLEGTPEFEKLTRTQKMGLDFKRANPAYYPEEGK